jgi:hypothetical protein
MKITENDENHLKSIAINANPLKFMKIYENHGKSMRICEDP